MRKAVNLYKTGLLWLAGVCCFAVLERMHSRKMFKKESRKRMSDGSLRCLLMSLSGGTGAILCTRIMRTGFAACIAFLFLCILELSALADVDTLEIPDGLMGSLAALGLLSLRAMPEISLFSRVIGAGTAIPFLILAVMIPGAFGGGDIKLIAAGGFFLGAERSVCALFIAVLSGGLWGCRLVLLHKIGRKEYMAFGPFLCLGMAAALFWGEKMIRWYLAPFFP